MVDGKRRCDDAIDDLYIAHGEKEERRGLFSQRLIELKLSSSHNRSYLQEKDYW